MKRISEYKKLFNVEGPIELATLKKSYRNLVKEWHPDKFREGDERASEAEEMSRRLTTGYEFLVSIAPETKERGLDEYKAMLETSKMVDFDFKGQRLEVEFSNGSKYEYFGVSKSQYNKLLNSQTQHRFAKRNIFSSCVYRKAKREQLAD